MPILMEFVLMIQEVVVISCLNSVNLFTSILVNSWMWMVLKVLTLSFIMMMVDPKKYDVGQTGDNGYWSYEYNEDNVVKVIVSYTGSGSVAGLTYSTCPPTPAPVATVQTTSGQVPSPGSVPSSCTCPADEADSWKCGLNLYYCETVQGICSQSMSAQNINPIAVPANRCDEFRALSLGDKCPSINGEQEKGLSHRACYYGNVGYKYDGSCGTCQQLLPPP